MHHISGSHVQKIERRVLKIYLEKKSFEAITNVLYKAHQNGRGSLSRQSLSDEVYTAHGYAQKTVGFEQ